MSLFNKIFGGGDKKKEAPPPPPPPPTKISKQIQAEATIVQLNQKIAKLEDDTNKYQYEAEIKTAKAKELMAANKKKEAKTVVTELAEIKKKIEDINTRKKVLRTQRTQMQTVMMDMDTADIMGKAVDVMKGSQDINEKINDIILDTREIQMNMEETNRLMKEIAGNNELQEQTDDLFAELQKEVNQQRADVISGQIASKVPVKPVDVSKATTITTKATVEDDLSKWLNV